MTFLGKIVSSVFMLDLRSLALMRILLGSILICDLISRSVALKVLYSDEGILSRHFLFSEFPQKIFFSFHMAAGSSFVMGIFFVLAGVFALALLVGYRTRQASFFSWIMLVSLMNRNEYVLNSSDNYLSLVLFIGTFLPWGERFSIDSFKKNDLKQEYSFCSLAASALILQVIYVYFFNGLSKLQYIWWQNGKALSLAFGMQEISRPAAEGMHSYPLLLVVVSKAVPFLEMILPFGLLLPFFNYAIRRITVAILIFFHVLVWIFFDIGYFSPVCIAVLIGLFPWITKEKLVIVIRKEGRITSVMLFFFMAACLVFNIEYYYKKNILSNSVRYLFSVLHWSQSWDMFSKLSTHSQQVVLKGVLADGRMIILTDNFSRNDTKEYKFLFREERFRKFNDFIRRERKPLLLRRYGHAVCKQWSVFDTVNAGSKLISVELKYSLIPKEKQQGNRVFKEKTVFKYVCSS